MGYFSFFLTTSYIGGDMKYGYGIKQGEIIGDSNEYSIITFSFYHTPLYNIGVNMNIEIF